MMTSYFNLLKYAATGIASPDMTYYDRMRASTLMGGAVQTLTGIPPMSFKADGTPLISWSMKGNGQQTGTPSPDNIIMPTFCGVRTANLFDGVYIAAITSVSGNTAILKTNSSGRTAIVKCEPNTTYTVKKYGNSNRFLIAESDIKPVNDTAMSIILNDNTKSEYSFATSSTTQYVVIYCSTSSEKAEPPLMLNLGSTALPYEPYGWAEKITCAGQTTPVYLGQVSTVRRIRKLVLDGTENLVKDSDTGQSARYYISVSDIENSTTNLLSTHFSQSTQYGIDTIRGYRKTIIFSVDKTIYATVADFKSYLAQQYAAGTPVTVWYVLAEPETAIVNEPLAKIGDYADELHSTDAGVSIPTIKGSNTLTVEAELQPIEMSITYRG